MLLTVLSVFILIAPIFIETKWRLMASVWLSLFQLYLVPTGGVCLSTAFICILTLWPETLRQCRTLLGWWPSRLIVVLILIQVLSFCWSSDLSQGVRVILFTLPFFMILAATIEALGADENLAKILLSGVVCCACIEAALVIVLHLAPTLEARFIAWKYVRIFINPNSFSVGYMQVPNWSGFLINPNTAAGYLGIASFIAMATALKYRLWWAGLAGVLLASAVVLTGSGAGIVLVLVLYCIWTLVLLYRWRGLLPCFCLIGALVLVAMLVLWQLDIAGAEKALAQSTAIRWRIWQCAVPAFMEHPIMGLGFGGWQKIFPAYAVKIGVPMNYPPHNTLIYLWSQSGLFAALLGMAFIAAVLIEAGRMRKARSWWGFAVSASFALTWYFVQQMGQNWGLLQQRHMVPLVAMILGIIYTINRQESDDI